jgi:hypothetical protein
MIFNMFNILLFALVIFEIIIILVIKNFRKDFKWLVEKKDEKPKFNKIKLKKFFKNSYHKNYGWDRKPLSSGFEYSNKKTKFKISKDGYRGDLKSKKNLISVFGDSFAFCRYVNDNMTWESILEKKLSQSVLNYGVGNFGLDQSFLKYHEFKNKISSKVIIFNFVPETIARINSYWKHYREFGNIHAFKPLLEIRNNNLKIIKNLIEKDYTESQIYEKLGEIKSKDIFFQLKFNKLSFKYPYSFTLMKNFDFYSKILINLFLFKIKKNKKYLNNSIKVVLNENVLESHNMYLEKKFYKKLENLILFMNNNLKKDKRKMIIIITPQLLDLKSGNCENYQKFFKKLTKKIKCLDLTENIKNYGNYDNLYFKDIYGGHLNELGNRYISGVIYKYLKNKKLI